MAFEYIQQHYGVSPQIGQGVIVYGKPGVIIEDRGHYIGVNFDSDKPGVSSNCHPIDGVVYGEMQKIKKPTKSQQRYQQYIDDDWFSESFGDYLKWQMYPGGKGREELRDSKPLWRTT